MSLKQQLRGGAAVSAPQPERKRAGAKAKAVQAEAENEEDVETDEEEASAETAAAAEEEAAAESEEEDEETPMAEEDEKAKAARRRERQRISAILGAPEAKGRTGMAQHLAFKTDLTALEAVGALAAAPKQSAGSGQLASRMAAEPPVKVGPGGSLSAEEQAGSGGLAADAQLVINAGRKRWGEAA